MTEYNREELIEEAAKAIDPPAWTGGIAHDPRWADEAEARRISAMRQARAAFSVFEQAHTPTDDKRVPGFAEREKRAARAWELFARTDREMSHDFRGGYHQGMIDGFRRSGAPEPSAWDGSVPDDDYGPWGGTEAEPQAEPSDAQVLAALNAYYEPDGYPSRELSHWTEWSVSAMRAALRAAGEV